MAGLDSLADLFDELVIHANVAETTGNGAGDCPDGEPQPGREE